MDINDLQVLIQLHAQAHANLLAPFAEQYKHPHAQEAHFLQPLPCDTSTSCKMYAHIGVYADVYADTALLTQVS